MRSNKTELTFATFLTDSPFYCVIWYVNFSIINQKVTSMKKTLSIIVCLLMSITMMMAQRTVTGTVTSAEDGEPIIGASVIVPGTKNGTVTDIDGNFSLKVPEGTKTLRFSYVGMATQDVSVKNKMNVILDSDNQVLDDVVVTAQGLTRKDKSIGYAAQKVDGEKLQMTRVTDLGNALAGKISGARFLGSSGATFDEGRIVLRGTTSFSSPQGSEPIYVIDGTITNKSSLNMDDVASINVLKGAAATSLYGSQGANGAVIITTKGATMNDGKGHIDVSHTIQWESYYNHYDMQKQYGGGSYGLNGQADAADYPDEDTMSPQWLFGKFVGQDANGAYYYDYFSDESWGPRYDATVKIADPLYLEGVKSTPNTWTHGLDLADLYRTGVSNTTNVSFSKNSRDISTRISFTNSEREGIQYNSKATRRFLSAKTTYKPASWVKVSLDYKYSYRKTKNAGETGYGALFSEYTQWGQTNVNLKQYKDDYMRSDGTIRTWNITNAENFTAMFHDNPYAIQKELNYVRTYSWNVIAGDIEFILPYNIKAGFRVNGNIRNAFTEDRRPAGLTNYGTTRYYENQNHVNDFTLQGRLTWGDRFIDNKLSADVAAFVEERQYHYGTLTAYTNSGLAIPNFFNLANSVSYVGAENEQQHYKTRAVFANMTLGYNDTYFLDANIRNDWDSRLSKSKNSYLYGGVSASVMVNQLLKADWLNYWKVRASMAQVGSTLSTYALSDYFETEKYNSDIMLYYRTTLLNQNIKPTISTSYEVGTEFRMFDNRFWGDINYYTMDTKNQILKLSTAPQSGFSTRQINCGLVRNRGIEVSLGGTPVKVGGFQWDIDVNFAHNKNELVELGGGQTSYNMGYNSFGSYARWSTYAIEGRPIGEIFGWGHFKRDEQGRMVFKATSSKSWGGGYQPVFVSETPDEQIAAGKSSGNYQPDLTGGFSTTFRYKQFALGMNFDFLIGGKVASWTNMYGEVSGTAASSAKINDRGVNEREPVAKGGGVHVVGVDTDGNPVDTYLNAYQWYHQKYYDTDSYMYDRTYVKMRELSFGYTFSRAQLKKYTKGVLSSASLSFVATNPWLIYSAVPNIDASEISTSSTSGYAQSIEGGSAGSTRSFGLTVKVGF